MRKGYHRNKLWLDLATVNVYEEYQHKGLFKQLLKVFQDSVPEGFAEVYLENMLNEHLWEYISGIALTQDNWLLDEETRCAYWIKG